MFEFNLVIKIHSNIKSYTTVQEIKWFPSHVTGLFEVHGTKVKKNDIVLSLVPGALGFLGHVVPRDSVFA